MNFKCNPFSLVVVCLFFLTFSTHAQIIEESETNDALVQDFGNALEQSILDKDSSAYIDLFSMEGFVARLDGLESDNEAYKQGFVAGVTGAINQLPEKIILEAADGYYDFVNYYYNSDAQTYQALFRLYNTNGGINYHDYTLTKDPNSDSLLFSDIYIYLSGENFSKTITRIFNIALNDNKLFNQKDFANLVKVIQYNGEGKFKASLNYANKIDGELGEDKFLMILKTIIAANVSEADYLDALKSLVAVHGDDKTINLNKIDYYTYLEEYDAAKEAVEQLMDKTQDDFLQLLLGNLYFEQSKFIEAQKHYKYIVDNYEGFFSGQSSYLASLTANEEYEKGILFLDELVAEYEKQDLIEYIEEPEEDGSNIFDAFVKSKAYETWKSN